VKIFNTEHLPAAQKLLQRIALIAAVFIFMISAFFILNYIQLKANPPLKSPALEKLYVQLDADPNNTELREQIRALDLLARKAYFTRQWQVNFGGYMLLAALVSLLLAIKSIRSMTIKFPELPKMGRANRYNSTGFGYRPGAVNPSGDENCGICPTDGYACRNSQL